MFLFGKLTLSIIGFKFLGIYGLFWGICLGHLLIDRTIITKFISDIDDNLRLLLPYRYYSLYDKLISPMFGKIWGIILGSIFGWVGCIVLAIVGHVMFDMYNPKFEKIKIDTNKIFSDNIFTIFGFTIGISFKNKIIIFVGILIGYIIDNMRSDSGLVSRLKLGHITKFWPKSNILKLFLKSPEAKKFALVKSMAGLSGKLCKSGGEITIGEINTFKRLFDVSSEDEKIMKVFNYAKETAEDFEPYAKQVKIIARDDIELKEDVIENLFELAVSDGNISLPELDMLKSISKIIELPKGNFEIIRKRYEVTVNSCEYIDYYKILGVAYDATDAEIRATWKKLTSSHHPDRIISNGGTAQDVIDGNIKMAEINEAYQQIMKRRKQL